MCTMKGQLHKFIDTVILYVKSNESHNIDCTMITGDHCYC